MIKTLLFLTLSCILASLRTLRITIITALLPRMPLPNWRKEVIYRYSLAPTKPTIVEYDFDDPAPQATRHPLTPLRPPPIREVNLTLLKKASERVSEILRENRRRLDAGEDPSTIRKAARRRRAIELSAVRRGQARLFL